MKPQTTPRGPSLREKFQIKPLELWELKLFDLDGFRCWRGTLRTFGFMAALTQLSPLANLVSEAARGFPYRPYSLVVNDKDFRFSDGKGCSTAPRIIDGGKK